jgi:hypothetical protein
MQMRERRSFRRGYVHSNHGSSGHDRKELYGYGSSGWGDRHTDGEWGGAVEMSECLVDEIAAFSL